ncbi:MAG: hypothetical protein WBZ20_18540 [Nitrososphaeraceae archaeon]
MQVKRTSQSAKRLEVVVAFGVFLVQPIKGKFGKDNKSILKRAVETIFVILISTNSCHNV